MKLNIAGYEQNIEFTTDSNAILVVENKKLFSSIIKDLYDFSYGNCNGLVNIEDEEGRLVKCDKVIYVGDILEHDLNSRTILTKLYKNIDQELSCNIELSELLQNNINKINHIIVEQLNDINVDFTYELIPSNIPYIKALNVKINHTYKSIYEKLLNIIEIYSEMFHGYTLIIHNTFSIFDTHEVENMLKYIRYKKINVILIENEVISLCNVKYYIIDEDFIQL